MHTLTNHQNVLLRRKTQELDRFLTMNYEMVKYVIIT